MLDAVPDTIVVTETWLGEHVVNFCVPSGFTANRTMRSGRRGGGVTVLCSDELRTKKDERPMHCG